MKDIFLYVDDLRTNLPLASIEPGTPIFTARSYNEAISIIEHMVFDTLFIDLDHDLGEGKTGYDICKFIVENQILPEKIKYHLHTANPVGRQNMEQLLSHYGYAQF